MTKDVRVRCEWCSKKMLVSTYRLNRSKTGLIFCCVSHKDRALIAGMKGNEKFKGLVPAHYKQVHTFKCKVCKKEFASAYVKDTCTRTCTNISKARTKIIAWKRNEFCPVTEDGSLLVWARKYLKDKANNQCSVCGWAEVNPFHGNTPLEIDHIDGNWQNYKYENFRVLCPNCHALTQHYKVYNKQNGKSRYDHWKEKGWW